jgi:hypothetical protein
MNPRKLSMADAIRAATSATLLIALTMPASPLWAQQDAAGTATAVTVKNFARAESDLYFGNIVKLGGFGNFNHYRTLTPIDQQTVVRMNRDTLYSGGVFDLDAGAVTITLPDTGKALHVAARHYGGSLRAGGGLRAGHRQGDNGRALCHVIAAPA